MGNEDERQKPAENNHSLMAHITAHVQAEREISNEVQEKALATHTTMKGSSRQTKVEVALGVSTDQTHDKIKHGGGMNE